ncbi:MAG: hypothetical protein E6G23_04460 [Actinobacteria bacterium]|nr:MAG: hypothetical protein E6G23_04460 [Actinomycetota bacterium]
MSTQIDTEHFRARLEDEQRKVRSAIEYLHKESPGVSDEITGDLAQGPGDNHLADMATETIDREIDYTLEENSVEHLPWATQCADDARGGRG